MHAGRFAKPDELVYIYPTKKVVGAVAGIFSSLVRLTISMVQRGVVKGAKRNQTDFTDEMKATSGVLCQIPHAQSVRPERRLREKGANPESTPKNGHSKRLPDGDIPKVPASKTSRERNGADDSRESPGLFQRSSALTLYLREVGTVELLKPAEERRLANRIRKGDAEARDQMIRANLRLVVKIAHDYDGLGLPLLDLINEGNIGLMSAVERFDPTRGAKLSTYASWWIKQSMRRALANQGKTIRLPVHMVDKIYHMRRVTAKLHETFGREPTDQEVAKELGITAREVADMRAAFIRPASLDASLGDDETASLSDLVRDENAVSPYEQLEEKTVNVMVVELVDKLQPREASVLRFRFGLDGGPERTLEEVGEKFGVTRERIRQLQNLALRKLRKMVRAIERMPEAA